MNPFLYWLTQDSLPRNLLFVFCLAVLWITIDALTDKWQQE